MTRQELYDNIIRLNALKPRLDNVLPSQATSVNIIFDNLNLQINNNVRLLMLHVFYESAIQQLCRCFNRSGIHNYSINMLENLIFAAEQKQEQKQRQHKLLNAPIKLRFSEDESKSKREETLKEDNVLTIKNDIRVSNKIKEAAKENGAKVNSARKNLNFNKFIQY